jgi:hypothetical protein
MPTSLIARLVDACCRHAWVVVVGFLVLAGVSAEYARSHFAINTDSSQLISAKLAWRQHELALDRAFPQRTDLIIAVIDGATPELADAAAAALTEALAGERGPFQSVRRPDTSPFFDRNGLLFLPPAEVADRVEVLIRAQPFLGTLAADPTLRGLAGSLTFIPQAVKAGQAKLDDFTRQLQLLGDAFEKILDGHTPRLSWAEVMTGPPPTTHELRRFVHVKPVLDFGALEPGANATGAIRAAAAKLGLDREHGVSLRLTGPVPMADEEFATIA